MNEVVLIGRVANDLELRYSQAGKAVMNFNIAVQRDYKNQNNEYEADFIRCTVFGKTAEVMANNIRKGHRIAVKGQIQTGSYQKDGRRVYTTDVIIQKFDFIDSKHTDNKQSNDSGQKQDNRSGGNYQSNQEKYNQDEPDPFAEKGGDDSIDISDDDLPF